MRALRVPERVHDIARPRAGVLAERARVASYDAERCPTSSCAADARSNASDAGASAFVSRRRRRRTAATRPASCTSRPGCAPGRCRRTGSARRGGEGGGRGDGDGMPRPATPARRPARRRAVRVRSIGPRPSAWALRANAYAQTAADDAGDLAERLPGLGALPHELGRPHQVVLELRAPRHPTSPRDRLAASSARRRSISAAVSKSPARIAAACAAVELRHLVDRGGCRQPLGDGLCVASSVVDETPIEHEGGVRGIPPRPFGEERRLSRADELREVGQFARQGRRTPPRSSAASRCRRRSRRRRGCRARRSSAVPRVRDRDARSGEGDLGRERPRRRGRAPGRRRRAARRARRTLARPGVCQSVVAASRRAMAAASTEAVRDPAQMEGGEIHRRQRGRGTAGSRQASSVGIPPRSRDRAAARTRRSAPLGMASQTGLAAGEESA